MSAVTQWSLCKAIRDDCHKLSEQISTHVINNLLMNIRLAKLDYEHFKKGLDAFKRIKHALNHQEGDPAVAQAFSAAEALIEEFYEDYRSKTGIFKHQFHINGQMNDMTRRLTFSNHVLENGSEDKRSTVIHTWEAAYSEAKTAWDVYAPMEDRIENCYKETEEQLQELARIEGRGVRNRFREYTGQDEEQLVAVRSKLQNVYDIGSKYLNSIKGPEQDRLEKATERIQKLMAEMTIVCKKVDDERRAKTNASVKQLQQEKKSETHVKYAVYVKVDDTEFRANVRIRNGQQPLFCAAKTRPFEPPVGMRETGNSKWTPPTLEALLGTTNDPQSIILKELNASSSHTHGSFSEKDIIVKLPQKNSPFSKTIVEISGTFGSNAGKHTAKITCTRKGTEKCTEYPCKEPRQTHWIDSGTNRS
ncbi:hypothetical protein ACEPAG_8336 [Sanghuangporus baumii]